MKIISVISQNIICRVLICSSLLFSQFLLAALPNNISPAQIAQFQKLPKSQQVALAKSMGIDLNALTGASSQANGNTELDSLLEQYNPREDNEYLKDEDEDSIQEVEPFGYNVFSNAPLTFAPSIDIAVPEAYLVGAGDSVAIHLFGKESDEYTVSISREGTILIPRLGEISVAGMTFSEVKSYLSHQIKEKVIGVQVVVTLAELRSIRVFVLGDAYKPGPYVLSALSSITHAIFAAGGINDIGSLRNIKLKRAGKLVSTLDLYDLLINGDSSDDLMLKSGDVILVEPVGKRVSIDGEVTRPAIYEVKNNDTFASVLEMSGGLLPSAYAKKSIVERFNNNLRVVKSIDLSNTKDLMKKVKDGDFIKVRKTSELYQDSVTLFGAVTHPGKYQWEPKQKISHILPDVHTALLDNADLAYGIVVREINTARHIEIHQFSMFDIVTNEHSSDNITLQPNDKILIFYNHNKPNSDVNLGNLALTEQELKHLEKSQAKDRYKEKEFWQEMDPSKIIEEEDISVLSTVSLAEFTGKDEDKVFDIREYNYFSRERMLAPIIEKLKQQASSGAPIKLVEVVGEVKYPGLYPLAVNSQVHHLIKAAGGLLESAYLEKAEITRNNVNEHYIAKNSRFSFNLKNAIFQGTNEVNNTVINNAQNISYDLQSKDRLNIFKIPAWQENHIVELRGEFIFPGKYTIQRGETLGSLIERAGGFTDYAYQKASIFTREKLKLLEKQNIEKVAENLRNEIASKSLSSESQNIDYNQAKVLLADLTKIKPVGRLVLNLPQIKTNNAHDVLLENGDFLYVPSKQNSINVVGQVQLAVAHMFNEGMNIDDYIKLSGGTKQQADEGRIYVIKANGGVFMPDNENWFTVTESSLEPGDSIVVPIDTDYMPDLKLWQTGTQIIYQSAVALAAITNL